nr:MAG TPA: hypothetical protein [Caudoviricetes sp.]DAP12594.1 MAG TPA: hypothetical protein [Caudoviricetes sp.]
MLLAFPMVLTVFIICEPVTIKHITKNTSWRKGNSYNYLCSRHEVSL